LASFSQEKKEKKRYGTEAVNETSSNTKKPQETGCEEGPRPAGGESGRLIIGETSQLRLNAAGCSSNQRQRVEMKATAKGKDENGIHTKVSEEAG